MLTRRKCLDTFGFGFKFYLFSNTQTHRGIYYIKKTSFVDLKINSGHCSQYPCLHLTTFIRGAIIKGQGTCSTCQS